MRLELNDFHDNGPLVSPFFFSVEGTSIRNHLHHLINTSYDLQLLNCSSIHTHHMHRHF